MNRPSFVFIGLSEVFRAVEIDFLRIHVAAISHFSGRNGVRKHELIQKIQSEVAAPGLFDVVQEHIAASFRLYKNAMQCMLLFFTMIV